MLFNSWCTLFYKSICYPYSKFIIVDKVAVKIGDENALELILFYNNTFHTFLVS